MQAFLGTYSFIFPMMLLGTDIPNQVFWNEIPTLMFRKMIPKLMHCKEIPIRVIRNGFSTAHAWNCPLSIILLPAMWVGCGAYLQSVVDPMWWGWGWAGTQLGSRILMSSKDLVHVMLWAICSSNIVDRLTTLLVKAWTHITQKRLFIYN